MPKLTAAERNKRKRERKKREKEERRKREEEEAAAQKAAPGDGDATDTTADATAATADGSTSGVEVEVEYVAAPLAVGGEAAPANDSGASAADPGAEEGGVDENDIAAVLRRFQSRSAVLVTDDEGAKKEEDEADAAAKTKGGPSPDDEDDLFDADDEGDGTPAISNRKRRELERPTVAELKNRVKRADLVEAHDVTAPDPDFLIALKSVPGTVPVPRHWGRKRKYLQGKVSFIVWRAKLHLVLEIMQNPT